MTNLLELIKEEDESIDIYLSNVDTQDFKNDVLALLSIDVALIKQIQDQTNQTNKHIDPSNYKVDLKNL